MLKAIRKFDRKRREHILADLILSRGAPVEQPDSQIEAGLLDVYQSILKEVSEALRVDPLDPSPDARRMVNSFLSRELRELTFDSKTVADSRKRLGQEGLLPGDLYDITFGEDFTKFVEPVGITRAEVREAIVRPSISEHYMPESYGQVSGHAVSLFVKVHAGEDPYTLLVDCQRMSASILVHYALRIFHSELDMSGCITAIDILSAFTKKFGVDFTVADSKETRFLFYETISSHPSQSAQTLFSWETTDRTPHVDCRFTYQQSPGVWTIALGYAVDVLAYTESLKRHGIDVRRKLEQPTEAVSVQHVVKADTLLVPIK